MNAPGFSKRRIWAMMLRHWYLLRGSVPRLLELAYWPTIQMVLWGFTTGFFAQHSNWVAQATGVLLSAVLLWDALFRANLGLSLSFLEEMWSRNLGQLFISPLRPLEMVSALAIMSLVRTIISATPAALLSPILFGISIFDLGPVLVAFFANIMVMGWSIGLVAAGLVLRFGLGAEALCWVGIFLISPICGIYYPISALPDWLQPVAWSLPVTHVFEGMRAVLYQHTVRLDLMAWAVGLNLVYLGMAAVFFLRTIEVARDRGLLLQQGE